MAETRALRLAHRGDWRVAPENTLEAFAAALRIPGCDGIELDIRCSADGVAVVLHDDTLERVQRIPAACVTLTAEQLAAHGISTLAEVLAAIGPEPYLDVELKDDVPSVVAALEAGRGGLDADGRPTLRSAVISSFHPEILAAIGEAQPSWPLWLNALDLGQATIDRALDLGCVAIAVAWRAVNEPSVARVRDAGLDVATWTVQDLADYRRLEALGVIAICAEAAALDG